jgi:hypothetical protein
MFTDAPPAVTATVACKLSTVPWVTGLIGAKVSVVVVAAGTGKARHSGATTNRTPTIKPMASEHERGKFGMVELE